MSGKIFTPEELEALRKNPYVKHVTEKTVRFTVAFKETFWESYQNGLPAIQIMAALGFDPVALGKTRIGGITQKIKLEAEKGEGFRDVRRTSALAKEANPSLGPSQTLQHMQHEIVYMKQELEFVKKVILADREAQSKCISTQERPQNSQSSRK